MFPFGAYLSYAIFNCVVTRRTGEVIYFTNDWVDAPIMALLFTLFILVLQVMCFTLLWYLSKIKIRFFDRLDRRESILGWVGSSKEKDRSFLGDQYALEDPNIAIQNYPV